MSKILNISPYCTPTVGFPPKEGTWKFLQDSSREDLAELIVGLIKSVYGNYSGSLAYVLYGCKSTDLGASTQFTDGAIFYNGEVFNAPSKLVTNPVGADVFIVNILTTQYTSFADPVTFTNLVNYNVHDIRKADFNTGTSGSGSISDFSSLIYPFELKVETKTGVTINGDTIDFTQNKTILYDLSISATATPTVALNLVNAIAGVKVRCIFAPDNSSSIAITSVTETGSADIIDRTAGMLPTSASAWGFIEYEYIGSNIVVRTIARFNP